MMMHGLEMDSTEASYHQHIAWQTKLTIKRRGPMQRHCPAYDMSDFTGSTFDGTPSTDTYIAVQSI